MFDSLPLELLAVAAVSMAVGAMAPVYYLIERLRGFGRAVVSKLPYRAPPGMDKETALVAATRTDYESDDVVGDRVEEGDRAA